MTSHDFTSRSFLEKLLRDLHPSTLHRLEISTQRALSIMALQKDNRKQYNNPEFSEVVIAFDGAEVHAHKVILARLDYFARMLKKGSEWAEATSGVVELKDDAPDVVETMMRFLYSFKYADIATLIESKCGPGYHLGVYLAAKKYDFSELRDCAFDQLKSQLQKIRIVLADAGDQSAMTEQEAFDLIVMLNNNAEDHAKLEKPLRTFITKHIAALVPFQPFREWLNNNGSRFLSVLFQAVTRGADTIQCNVSCRSCSTSRQIQLKSGLVGKQLSNVLGCQGCSDGDDLRITTTILPENRT